METTNLLFKVNNLRYLKQLIKSNNNININDQLIDGKTPLHCYKNLECLEFLLQNGADPNIKDNYDKTPIFYYFSKSHRELLEKYGARIYRERFNNTLPGENYTNLQLMF